MTSLERIVASDVPDAVRQQLTTLAGVRSVSTDAHTCVIEVNGAGAMSSVLALLVESGVTRLSTRRPSLEEVYLKLIGDRGLRIA